MAQKLIRDIPDETMHAIEVKAAEAGKNAEAYIRDLLVRDGALPIVKERYAIHFSTIDGKGVVGLIRRFNDHENGTSSVWNGGPTMKQIQAIEQAKRLVAHNAPGDREEAFKVLRSHFGNVFEMPV